MYDPSTGRTARTTAPHRFIISILFWFYHYYLIHIYFLDGIVQSSPAEKKARQAQAGRQQKQSWWNKLFGGKTPSAPSSQRKNDIGTLVKQRKAPIKIEPKVFFANERTFLAWMHLSVTLAGASIAILAFAQDDNPLSQMYGVILLPVAIAFIIYSMYQYARRASMIRSRHPGPYEDTVGPVVLGVMLMTSIVAQFALKLYTLTEST